MLAKKVTISRLKKEPIIYRVELKKFSDVALEKVASNFLQYKELKELDYRYKIKVFDQMSVDYPIDIVFPLIDHEPYWEKACKAHFKVEDCTMNGNSWKQCYAENTIKQLISKYNPDTDNMDQIMKIFDTVKFHIFNLELPSFSSEFDISKIPQYFVNLTTLDLKYSPVLWDQTTTTNSLDIFRKKLDPIKNEYSKFGMKVPDLKKFSLLMGDLSYLLSLSLQGNIIDDDMVKWLVAGLITNHTLRYLDLSSNKISDQG
jgi:hypothetical protein